METLLLSVLLAFRLHVPVVAVHWPELVSVEASILLCYISIA